MGNKTNPISNRLGIISGWKSSWFGRYPERIQEDYKIRKHIEAYLLKGIVSLIYIERRPTFLMDIDYATAEANTTYGIIGIKVWINKGEVYGKREFSTIS